MIYGYARVSTKGQEKNGNSLDLQQKQLNENGAEIIFSDSFTGTKANRPELDRLLSILVEGDTLIVTKLDRVARSLSQGSDLVNNLIRKAVKVNILNIGIMDNTPSSKLIRNLFFSFAEFERDMIVERTQEGKEIAKQKDGFTEGRPKKYNKDQMDHAINLLRDHSYNEVVRLTGISKSTLVRGKLQRENRV